MFIERENIKSRFKFEHWQVAVTLAAAIICLTLSLTLPARDTVESVIRNVFFLVFIPALYIKFVLKKNIRDFGFNLDYVKQGAVWTVALLGFFALLDYFLIKYTNFGSYHALPASIVDNFWLFLVYELIFVNIYTFTSEFFFKGFVLFAFSSFLSFWSVLVVTGIHLIFLLLAHQSIWMIVSSIAFMLLGAFSAYKTKSFFYSYFASILFNILLDAYLIHAIK